MILSPRLAMPFIAPGQAQKELLHNEALQVLDAVVAAAVEELPRADPPASPLEGDTYIVGDSPSGAWAGQAGKLANFTAGGWRLIAPPPGMTVFIKSTATLAVHNGGTWEIGALRGSRLLVDGVQVIGPQTTAITDPSGGSTVDAEARSTIAAILAALRQHGLISS